MSDFEFDLDEPTPPVPPGMGPTGFPIRTGRAGYGPVLRDERKLANPEQELNAQQLNMTFWQLGGLGLVAPLALLVFDPVAPLHVRLGLFAWHQLVLVDTPASGLPSWLTVAVPSTGTMTFTFTATVPGRDGLPQALTLRGGTARPFYFPAYAGALTNHRCELDLVGNVVTVRTRTTAGVLVEAPIVLELH